MKHLTVIDPALRTAETDSFNFIAKRAGLACTYHLPGLLGPASLAGERLTEIAGVVILGSAASVNDTHEWQTTLKGWLARAIERDIPVLGICYGHQLLAEIHGGKVGFLRESREKAKGLRRIEICAGSHFGEKQGEVVVSHNETVLCAPERMKIIASSSEVAVEGLQHESRRVFSFQAHLEATADFLDNNGLKALVPADRLGFGHELIDTFLEILK